MTEKLPTINLKGKDYVLVKDRVEYFNATYELGSIQTEMITQSSNIVVFKAVIIPDIELSDRRFTGHSFGTIDDVKAFEKLETVAVGRALAMMGIGIVDSIASADEMDRFHKKEDKAAQDSGAAPASSIRPCDKCGSGFKLVPAGTSAKTGKAYDAFYACSNKDCKRTLRVDDAMMWQKTEAIKTDLSF